nr:hypothetical protein [Nannocystis sp.]
MLKITRAAPAVSPGYIMNAIEAPHRISFTIIAIVNGMPPPPSSLGADTATQPPSAMIFHASL